MLAVEDITPVPNEQRLITVLDPLMAPLYRELPYHNYPHARDEVLVEALRLDELDRSSRSPRQRFEDEREMDRLELIVEALGHDVLAHLKLDPLEGFTTKAHRTAAKVAELLRGELPERGFTFNETSIGNIKDAIISNTPGQPITTMNELKLRRADISNVGSPYRSVFLAKTVAIFREAVIISSEENEELPEWTRFLDRQHPLLSGLAEPGLAIGNERMWHGKSRFDRNLERNISLLATKRSVRDPRSFVGTYGPALQKVVPNFAEIALVIDRAAA